MAITTRMMTGMMVQATSRMVLWCTLDGTGLALARYFNATQASRARTKRQTKTMM